MCVNSKFSITRKITEDYYLKFGWKYLFLKKKINIFSIKSRKAWTATSTCSKFAAIFENKWGKTAFPFDYKTKWSFQWICGLSNSINNSTNHWFTKKKAIGIEMLLKPITFFTRSLQLSIPSNFTEMSKLDLVLHVDIGFVLLAMKHVFV